MFPRDDARVLTTYDIRYVLGITNSEDDRPRSWRLSQGLAELVSRGDLVSPGPGRYSRARTV